MLKGTSGLNEVLPMVPDSGTAVPVASSLRQATWTTPVLLVGLFVILIWGSVSFIPPSWLTAVPWWLLFAVAGVMPQLFLLIYPLVTRKQQEPSRFRLPKLMRLLIEAGIAVAVIFGCLVLLVVVELVGTQISPETSLTRGPYDYLGKTAWTPFIYGFFLAAFLYVPLAEEVFFRGFLFNAFRKRMPLVIAVLLQSVIFGALHFFSLAYAIITASLGLVLALVYCWRKTILTPVLVHAGINAIAAMGLFLSMHSTANTPSLGVMHQESATGCVIGAVAANSPAESAGLRPGDTIVQFGDYAITDFRSLSDTIASHYKVGDSVIVLINRDGKTLETRSVLARRSEISWPSIENDR